MDSTKLVLVFIGLITLFVGIYAYFTGKAFGTYFPAIFFGITVLGAGLMKKHTKNEAK